MRNSLAIDHYLEVLARRKWAVIIPVALSLLAAAVLLARAPNTPDQYEATSTVRLAVAGKPTGAAVSLGEASIIANSANYVLESDSTLARIAQEQGLSQSPARLRGAFEIVQVPGTEFIEIRARAASQEDAVKLANALAAEWPRSSAEFYTQLKRPDLAQSFVVFQDATSGVPVESSVSLQSGWVMRVVLALAMGMVGGLGIVFLTEYTDRTLSSPEGVAAASNASVLSSVPWLNDLPRWRFWGSGGNQPLGPEMGRARELRAVTVQLMHAVRAQRLRTILFTGIWPGDGTTSIATNVASSLAGDEFDVLLVDGNLEHPAVHEALAVHSLRPGLTDVLASAPAGPRLEVALGKATRESGRPGLRLLTAGTPAPDAWSVLASFEMRRLVQAHNEDERDRPELMIIDGPPIVASASALTLASVVGGVVVVCAEGSGTTEDLQRGLDQLSRLGANLLGVVYNKARSKATPGLPFDDRGPFFQPNGHQNGIDSGRAPAGVDDAGR